MGIRMLELQRGKLCLKGLGKLTIHNQDFNTRVYIFEAIYL